VDARSRTLEILGLQLMMSEAAEIKDVDKRALSFAALQPGMRVKVKGRMEPGGRFAAHKLKLRLPTPDAMDEIESEITGIDAAARTLTVMGFEVHCGPEAEIEA
jgi:hypothetical protein